MVKGFELVPRSCAESARSIPTTEAPPLHLRTPSYHPVLIFLDVYFTQSSVVQ